MEHPNGIKSLDFFTSGSAVFTVDNGRVDKDHRRYTYWIQERKHYGGVLHHYVRYLAGADNTNWRNYIYLGMLNTDDDTWLVEPTTKSRFTSSHNLFQAINWALEVVRGGNPPPANALIIHEGRCARCSRRLTTPESITRGIGPECLSKIQKEERGAK